MRRLAKFLIVSVVTILLLGIFYFFFLKSSLGDQNYELSEESLFNGLFINYAAPVSLVGRVEQRETRRLNRDNTSGQKA